MEKTEIIELLDNSILIKDYEKTRLVKEVNESNNEFELDNIYNNLVGEKDYILSFLKNLITDKEDKLLKTTEIKIKMQNNYISKLEKEDIEENLDILLESI